MVDDGDEKAEAQSRGLRIAAGATGEDGQEGQGEEDIARQVGTNEAREEHRRDALSAYLDERVAAGYRIETRGVTQAIIAPTGVRSVLGRFRRTSAQGRQVVSVDDRGEVTVSPAEPLRS